MDMLLSLDTAEISEIEEAAGWGVLGGVTTNPTLIFKSGHANPEIAIQYNVMGIPTLGLFRDGKLVDRMVGYSGGAAPIRAWLEKTTQITTASK